MGPLSTLDILSRLKRSRTIRWSPADIVRAERLLSSREDWNVALLASSLASLLATDRESWHRIHEEIHHQCGASPGSAEHARDLARPQEPTNTRLEQPGSESMRNVRIALAPLLHTPPPPPRWRRMVRARRVVLAAALLVTAGSLLPGDCEPPPSPVLDAGPPPIPDAGPSPVPDIPIKPLVPKRSITGTERILVPPVVSTAAWLLVVTMALAGWILAASGLHWLLLPWQLPHLLQQQARKLRSTISRQGSTGSTPYHIERTPPFARTAMDDAAAMLGRIGSATSSIHLDITATVERTSRAAGRIEPVFTAQRRSVPLLVLVDVEKGDHPFLDGVEWLLAHWQRIRLPIVRYDYEFIPARLWRKGGGPTVTLEQLGRNAAGMPLLLFTRMLDARDADRRLSWLAKLAPWPARALLDLDPRHDSERPYHVRDTLEDCSRAGLPLYAFTADGLLAAARALTIGHQPAVPPTGLKTLHDHDIRQAVIQWATCAALVPDPTWIQLEAIRRHIQEIGDALPDRAYVQRLIEWVRERSGPGSIPEGETGRMLSMPEKLEDDLIAAQRHADQGKPREDTLEWRGRSLLIEQLRGARPASDMDRIKRDLKLAVHCAVLEPARAGALLSRFVGSAVDEELRRLLSQQIRLQRAHQATLIPFPEATWQTMSAWISRHSRVPVKQLAWPAVVAGSVRGAALSLAVMAVGVALVFASWQEALEPRTVIRPLPGGYIVPGTVEIVVPTPVVTVLADQAPMRFVRLRGGEFWMGSPESEEGRYDDEVRHRVSIAAFEIAVTEVTQKQWQVVMGTNPSDCDYGCGDELPVQNVIWLDAVAFMNKLTELEVQRTGEALTTCYELLGEEVSWKPDCTGYRLPSEAEWEYAARAGSVTAYSFGEDPGKLGEYAWYGENAGMEVHAVGTKKGNAWGVHDMHGNAWEWVWDWYGEYTTTPAIHPHGPSSGTTRVLRGGSFGAARFLRSAYRFRSLPAFRNWSLGLRCARGASPALSP